MNAGNTQSLPRDADGLTVRQRAKYDAYRIMHQEAGSNYLDAPNWLTEFRRHRNRKRRWYQEQGFERCDTCHGLFPVDPEPFCDYDGIEDVDLCDCDESEDEDIGDIVGD